MNIGWLRLIITLTTLLTTLLGCSLINFGSRVVDDLPISSDVFLFDPEVKQEAQWPNLLLRSDADKNGLLLKRFDYSYEEKAGEAKAKEKVWRYDPKAITLSLASATDWEKASGPVGDSYGRSDWSSSSSLVRIDRKTSTRQVLLKDGRKLVTAGETPLDFAISPSGRKVAILSASGGRSSSGSLLMPFGGNGWIVGQHYHQVWLLPSGLPLGEAVRLPLRSKYDIKLRWSPDEKYVMYNDSWFRLVFVPVLPEGENTYEVP
jgi:hypothetical protein